VCIMEMVTGKGDSFPLPMFCGLECHPTGAVAQDAFGIRCDNDTRMIERPAWSGSTGQGDPDTVPHSIMEKDDRFNKDFHPGDQASGLLGSGDQPQRLNAVGEHGEESDSSERAPISHAKILALLHSEWVDCHCMNEVKALVNRMDRRRGEASRLNGLALAGGHAVGVMV